MRRERWDRRQAIVCKAAGGSGELPIRDGEDCRGGADQHDPPRQPGRRRPLLGGSRLAERRIDLGRLELTPEEAEAAHLAEQDQHREIQRHEAGDRVQEDDGHPLAEPGTDGEEHEYPDNVRDPDEECTEREPGKAPRQATFHEVERENSEDEEADERVDA